MWRTLGDEWGLSDEEYAYIDRQQGEKCVDCKANLRSQALALAILLTQESRDNFRNFSGTVRGRLLRILEINNAGDLTGFFRRRSRHELRFYPELDMMNMSSIASGKYDLVVHSDTLEHVPDPVRALRECCRVLRLGGGVLLHGAHRGGATDPLATRPPPQLPRSRERQVRRLPCPNRVRRGFLAASPGSRLR